MSERYQLKPFVVEAIRWDGANCVEVFEFLGYPHEPHDEEIDQVLVETPYGERQANVGDWIVRNRDGRVFPMPAERFAEDYEPAREARDA